jgi:hypothetical protein
VSSATINVSGEVPEDFARLGFSGMFGLIATAAEGSTDADMDALVAKMPFFTPGQRDVMITLREGDRDDQGRRTVVLVVRDDSAFMACMTRKPVAS